ncbi:hypothetical protein [Halomonas urumqiensis]|uniref:Uncharacterized protein n=1 Tax=Halomonas urumqiensis TaxID=1684789 RepID=A0A2N7UML5_9GAMM|nr:hypothetical protein [Halomonas urumqiensis]PMR81667.1 hypothetical protein C1H70_04525 [Halomonas urumqiensis]PTB02304.1 hypothetical protein C6V82_11505 [Halomonas urumqiensis]GHE21773.1 hypothetical protein GCM10017767_22940 [Halomonas urumqiensis]
MTVLDILSIGASIIASLGGGAVIVFALSNWLGKLWAERLMESERHQHVIELEELKDSLKRTSEEQIASIKAHIDIAREAQVKEHSDRVAIYRAAIDLIAVMVAKVEMMMLGKRGALTSEELQEFESQRLRVYAYLAMHAPQSVMDAHDALTDLILAVIYDGKETNWESFRGLAINFLNEIRKDVGIRVDPITYQGER